MADYLAVQKRLNQLGADPLLVEDGIYGPKTRGAVIAFQQRSGLVADGIVGPKTTAALQLGGAAPPDSGGGSLMGNAPPPSGFVQQAFAVAQNAARQVGLSEKQLQYTFTVAKGEGGFGQGWGNPSASTIAKSQKFGLTGFEGKGSNNWGATQGSGNAGSFPHVDSGNMIPDENGQPTSKHWQGKGPKVWGDYVANYRKWNTPEDGFLDMVRIILGGGKRGAAGAAEIKAAIESGNLREAVFAQHRNGYFELNPEHYLSAVMRNYQSLTGLPGWRNIMSETGALLSTTAGKVGIGLAGALGIGAAALLGVKLLSAKR